MRPRDLFFFLRFWGVPLFQNRTWEGSTRWVPVCIMPRPCTDGATRCSSDNTQVETCGDEQWTPTTTCDPDQICRIVSDDAQCVVEALAIIEVKWVWVDTELEPCTYMTPSDVTITTTANFADLDYSGSVTDCTGDFDRSEVVLTCENQTLMAGSVTVTDPRNNDQATVSFAGCLHRR